VTTTSQSPLDTHQERVLELVAQGLSNAQILRTLDNEGIRTSERSLRRALARWGQSRRADKHEKAGLKIDGDNLEAVSKPSPTYDYNTPDDLLLERGIDPEEWELNSLVVNEWDMPDGDGGIMPMKQLKVQCKRKKPQFFVMPAEVDISLPNVKYQKQKPKDAPKVIVCVGDQQAPYYNKQLHYAFQLFLADVQPDEGVLIGDTIDLPKISRHKDEPLWAATTKQCVDAGGQIIYDYRTASLATKWKKLAGNHDERIRRSIIDQISDFYDLSPASIPGLPDLPAIHDPRLLLRLNELDVEYIEPNGGYNHAQVQLSPFLAARHGWLARKTAGASAHATLDHLGHSVIVGHTHRQSRVHQTKHTIDGRAVVNAAVETGCMCRVEEGLGYAVAPDWQNGFAVASVWPDGFFSIDLATFVDGVLIYRDKRYK
jgi:hypothetical protein